VLLATDDASLREIATLEMEEDEHVVLHPDGKRFWLRDRHERARLWGLDALEEGRGAMRRPILPVDNLDAGPSADEPLDAAWLQRADPWWCHERARRAWTEGRFADAEQALDEAARLRPGWAMVEVARARLRAAKATAERRSAADVVPDLVRLFGEARRKGIARTSPRATWPELAPYADDPALKAALRALQTLPDERR
jgi:hypothetical protein